MYVVSSDEKRSGGLDPWNDMTRVYQNLYDP